ncbi:AraC family transcriptional regulator [Pseudonocardia xinjiangensis]|uniref:AraC family transcriptional regulator n=1 Tax=Pseudonocardia xinjiangensis TaxID=75289 RepID=UPI003D8AC09A
MDALGRLRSLISRHAGEGVTPTALPGVGVMASATTTEPVGSMAEPTVAVVVQGAKKTVLGDRVFSYGAGQYLVVSVDLPVTGAITRACAAEPFLALILRLDPGAIAALLRETAAAVRPGPVRGIAVSDAGPALLDAAARLLGLLEQPQDVTALAPGYEREILWRLVSGEQGAMVRQIGLADSHLSHLGRAICWLRGHYEQTIRIEDLAEMSAMSVSSFHRHFRAVTEMTPIQFQKQVRLQEARARLIAQPGTVAGVGFAVGYDSPSQFSREYRRMFGVSPGRDAARMRTPSPAR